MESSIWIIRYADLFNDLKAASVEQTVDTLTEEIPYIFYDIYKLACKHEYNVSRFTHGTFEYIYDDCGNSEVEPRLIAVIGKSKSQHNRKKDDNRLKGWIGPSKNIFGPGWDKGHFIGHSLGGAVDGIEANVFPQKSSVNRGGLFRKMERYCKQNPGTFCFNRPIYIDDSARPAFFDFGLVKTDNTLWVENFDNR